MNAQTNLIASSERKIWPLTGGVHPEENKHQSTTRPIGSVSLPETLVLPLSQHAGTPAEPVVAVGDKVLKGQLIARASGVISAPLHAPSSGVISAIEPRPIPHPSGFSEPCIVLSTDGAEQWCELTTIDDYRQLPPEDLVAKVRAAGISGMGGAGFPTAIKLSSGLSIRTLIINGTECEPYITADDMLMREQAQAIIAGAEILQYMLGADECLIGIEDNKPEAIMAMKIALSQSASADKMEIVVFPTIYPSGGEKQLIQILTGQEVPSGKLPADLGIVMQNVGTAVAVKEAVVDGKPLISRITTLTGAALQTPGNVAVLIGTPAHHLLQHAGLQESQLGTLVFGGPMMGFSVERLDIPVTKTANCIIAATRSEFPEAPDPQACIRCGHCAQACPASLLPQQLYWHAKAENYEQLLHHNLFDCIECGACAFVCPSAIPLVQYYRASKGVIRTLEAKQVKSERSKARYESRLARMAQESAEKEAKRQANAERAARLKAAKANEQSGVAEEDPIQAAIARAKARKAATAGQEKPARVELSAKQKELKIQLSIARAQVKKTEKALSAAQASGDDATVARLKPGLDMLHEQVTGLEREFDSSSSPAPSAREAEKPAKKDQPALSIDEKKRKVELAMANAAVKKLQRALESASEEDAPALKQQLADAGQKVADLKQAMENRL